MNQINNKIPTGLSRNDKIFWIALATFASLVILSFVVFMYYTRATAYTVTLEAERVNKERDEIMQQKCFDPVHEYEQKFEAFVKKHNLNIDDPFASAGRTGDPLNEIASSLQNEKKLVEDACNDARSEAQTINQVSRWEFFKSQWKTVLRFPSK